MDRSYNTTLGACSNVEVEKFSDGHSEVAQETDAGDRVAARLP